MRTIHIPSNIDFVKYKNIYFIISAFLVLISILLISFKGINFGIDFKGGSVLEIKVNKDASYDIPSIREVLISEGLGDVQIQPLESGILQIKSEEKITESLDIKKSLSTVIKDFEVLKVDYVGPTIGASMIKSALYSIIMGFIAIFIYVLIRFEWHLATIGLIALMHDIIITLGLSALFGYEFNVSSVVAVLTIIGYSINDTVVVFDHVRDNMRKYVKMNIYKTINMSLSSVLSRSIHTSTTTLLVSLSIFFIAGGDLKSFGFIMISGIIIGTYSSLLLAAPLMMHIGKSETL